VQVIDDADFGAGEAVSLQIAAADDSTIALLQFDLRVFRAHPDALFARARLLAPSEWHPESLSLLSTQMPAASAPDSTLLWAFQGASYEARPDWIMPIKPGYRRDNYMGMNASDYGGGIPVVDLWRPDYGLALGHAETKPVPISLPVQALADSAVQAGITWNTRKQPWTEQSPELFLLWHEHDFFDGLQKYAAMLRARGWNPQPSPKTAFEPQWCAWGYERQFDPQVVLHTLPKVAELDYRWAVLDDGWQIAEGEWFPDPQKFPRGDADLKAFVDSIHAQGLKAGVWWAPLCADSASKVAREHPDWFLMNEKGERQLVTWWDADYLCPALPEVIAYHKQVVRRLLVDYGFDGIKIDGQHLNAAPACYNPEHHHPYPEIASESVPALFAAIREEAEALKPGVVLQLCPCGDTYSVFNLPYYNQTVASDPTSSFQIRLKAKSQKALLGDARAFYGDHVELSDGGTDFASTVGLGGVIGTKFTWPHPGPDPAITLTPEREQEWRKWSRIYARERLPFGEYRNLYDMGYDRPEGHAIARGDTMYYAFFAENFSGKIPLRGLQAKMYRIVNYETGDVLGEATGPVAQLRTAFRKHRLLKAIPSKKEP